MEGGSFEDDFVDPHRFRYAEYKQKARFRASKQGQSIYNEDQDDQRYNNNYTDFHNRRSRSMPNRNTYQEGMEFSFGRFREQERENRYFPDYKERKDRYFQNKMKGFSHKVGNSQILNTNKDNKQTDVLSPIEVCFLTTDWSELSHETHTTLINFIMTLIRREHKKEWLEQLVEITERL